MVQITYQKRNGDLINRIRKTYPSFRVGDTTSMGWKVIEILYRFNGKYYSYSEYCKLVDKESKRDTARRNFKRNVKNFYSKLIQCMTFIIAFRVFEVLTKIANK